MSADQVAIPEAALDAAAEVLADYHLTQSDAWDAAADAVRAAAPLIVAAWAESVAREYWSESHISKVLRERASVLRGEGDRT